MLQSSQTRELESVEAVLELFADPDSGVAGHYVVDRDPRIVSVVPEYENAGHGHNREDLLSIVMVAVQNDAAFSDFQYRAVAQRVRNMARQWDFEPDREHILAADLGAGWDWDRFMALVTGLPAAKRLAA